MDIKIIFEDENVLVVDKPAGFVVFPEGSGGMSEIPQISIIDHLIEKYPALKAAGQAPRYGAVHRLDKDTSGVLLVAKTSEALIFFQNQFKNREIEKKYIALATGAIKENGEIKTLLGRSPADPRKQKVYLPEEQKAGLREAVTEYKVLRQFEKYTLLEVAIKTGRKHQIRCHLAHIHHPIAGDQLYGFKDSPLPEGLTRQFLHASYLKIKLSNDQAQEFSSQLPQDLQTILEKI